MAANPNPEPPPFVLTDMDREVLSQTDDEFAFHDWDNLKDIIGTEKKKKKELHFGPCMSFIIYKYPLERKQHAMISVH